MKTSGYENKTAYRYIPENSRKIDESSNQEDIDKALAHLPEKNKFRDYFNLPKKAQPK